MHVDVEFTFSERHESREDFFSSSFAAEAVRVKLDVSNNSKFLDNVQFSWVSKATNFEFRGRPNSRPSRGGLIRFLSSYNRRVYRRT